MIGKTLKLGCALTMLASPALAQAEFTLRIQTLVSLESIAGQTGKQFAEDVEIMSGDRLDIEMFYSSAVVKSAETFDAAINGILDADMTQPSYQIGKDPAFQFIGDVLGGYETPWQFYAFFYHGGGVEFTRELYKDYGMYLVGWYIHGPESLASTAPLEGPDSLVDWKFRSPPGMQTKVFANMGASPIVIDFTEVFTALEAGIIDGADASNIAQNQSMGLYDVANHATYPGFHSMPADHLAIRLNLWESMPEDLQRIIEVAWQKAAFRNTLAYSVDIQRAANELAEKGITLHEWSPEDRDAFREAAVAAWDDFATTDKAKEAVELHKAFLEKIGLSEEPQ